MNSAAEAFAAGIEQRPLLQSRLMLLPEDLYGPAIALIGDLPGNIAHRHRQPRAVRVTARCDPAPHRAPMPDRFIADDVGVSRIDDKASQAQSAAGLSFTQRRLLANEIRVLTERYKSLETGLERTVDRPVLARPGAIGFFQSQ